jgi:hypothetical protein
MAETAHNDGRFEQRGTVFVWAQQSRRGFVAKRNLVFKGR